MTAPGAEVSKMATPSNMPLIALSENHRRSISITLRLVDKTLCEWDDWARGRVRVGVMYRQRNTFSSQQRSQLQNKIANIRQLIARLRDDLQLETSTVGTGQSIVGQAALLWEMLVELNSRSLGGYGKVSEQLASYLDPIGNELAEGMNEIARFFSQPTPA
jgi:hypothetical protein